MMIAAIHTIGERMFETIANQVTDSQEETAALEPLVLVQPKLFLMRAASAIEQLDASSGRHT